MEQCRVILNTGKGGVGKTSIACATAIEAARNGRNVLLMSTDPAHSLADALGQPLGADPVEVVVESINGTGALQACEVRTQHEMERSWRSIRGWLSKVLATQGVADIRAEELTVPPGMDELFSLIEIDRWQRAGEHDLIVVDCAPTGETLRLLGFPEVIKWWLERVFPRNRALLGAARPLARSLDIPLPAAEAVEDLERLATRLLELNTLLRDADTCSVRLVLTPDRMVVAEAKRTYTYLALYGFATDAVIANRVLPPVSGPFIEGWREAQQAVLAEVDEAFAPIPVLQAPWLDSEAIGAKALAQLGARLFESHEDPGAVLHHGPQRKIMSDADGALVRVPVPFADRDRVAVRRIGEELIVDVNDQRRTIMLPGALHGSRPAGASINDGVLEIRFEEGDDGRAAG